MGRDIVYILDDDEAIRTSLAFYLTSAGFFSVQFASPAAFLDQADHLQPGCLLLDVRMPEMDGLEVLQRLVDRKNVLAVVVMTGHGDVVTAVRAMKLGALDFVEKPFEENLLLGILARVFATLDGAMRDHARQRHLMLQLSRLTPREHEVLVRLVAGLPNKLIAFDLGISIRTVEVHRSAMMDRLGVRTFAEALRVAIEGGLAATITSGAGLERPAA